MRNISSKYVISSVKRIIASLDSEHRMYYNVIQKGGASMTISLRISDDEGQLMKQYAEMKGLTISELVRRTVLERIEDELDLKACEEAVKKYKENSVTYSHEEVARMLDL